MQIYKILKLYPSLPKEAKVGDILNLEHIGFDIFCYVHRIHIEEDSSSIRLSSKYIYNINRKEVENSPEFFKKCDVEIKIIEI